MNQAEEQVPMGTADRVSRLEQHCDILANRVYKLEQEKTTFRDYFAAAALQHVMATADRTNLTYSVIAADCYRIADAMLAERKRDD